VPDAQAVTASFETKYMARSEKTRSQRLTWFNEARFGMFVHWGLYSQIGRNEWVMNLERIPKEEYEPLADSWKAKPGAAKKWVALAKAAGMKYIVLTAKHHEGFCLWDTKQTPFNSVKRGPKRDLVAEYVKAAREAGLKVGLYYSLMDWYHPDGILCAKDEAARKRFTEFTRGCVRELLSNYGKIDILWYDVSWPLSTPQAWDSFRLNDMARKLQPHIIINDRSQIPEDFGTPEEHIKPATGDRAWEACMTFNGSWGWQQTPPEDWHSARKVIDMLRICTGGAGNLLLNIGPHPDGSVPTEAIERLTTVGRWLKTYGPVMYGKVDRAGPITSALGNWTRKGNTVYFWCSRWPGKQLAIAAVYGKLLSARVYPNGKPLTFEQTDNRLLIKGLPEKCPDQVAHVGMIEMVFARPPQQFQNFGPVLPDFVPVDMSDVNISEPVLNWLASRVQPKPAAGVAEAPLVKTTDNLGWTPAKGDHDGFVNVHDIAGQSDGLIYLTTFLTVKKQGTYKWHVGHDGGVRVFVDGKPVLCEPVTRNPAMSGRSNVTIELSPGSHDVMIALDTATGRGWGVFLHLEATGSLVAKKGKKAVFPAFGTPA
jgi:alpha-L-fucosidase